MENKTMLPLISGYFCQTSVRSHLSHHPLHMKPKVPRIKAAHQHFSNGAFNKKPLNNWIYRNCTITGGAILSALFFFTDKKTTPINESSQLETSKASQVPYTFKQNGDEIAEALQSEVAFTTALDKKPVVATYGCGPCVAVGGYDPTNKIAFIVHFATPGEVKHCGGLIFYNLSKLAKRKIEAPIQLHLRGGEVSQSEDTIEAIKMWMRQRDDLPMEIASEDILDSGIGFGKSLLIDSRNGAVSEYDPMTNPHPRHMNDLDIMMTVMSAYHPNISIAYAPEQ